MKKIFKIFVTLVTLGLIPFISFTQSTVHLRGDTIRAYKQGGKAVFKADSVAIITGNATIGRSLAAINYSASLDLRDSTSAIILNRMWSSANVLSPVDGMVIYQQSDDKFYGRVNGVWVEFGSGGSGSSALSDITAAVAANTISNSNDPQIWKWDLLTGKTAFTFSSASTLAASDAQVLVQMSLTGTNANSGEITNTLVLNNDHAGTGAINTALAVGATNGAVNYAIYSQAGLNKFLGAVELGETGTSLGALKFYGNTSGVITIQSLAAAGTYTLTLPANDGDAGQFLQTDGSGVLSWATGGAGADDQTLQEVFNTEIGGSVLTKIDTIQYGNSKGIRTIGGVDAFTEWKGDDATRIITMHHRSTAFNAIRITSTNFVRANLVPIEQVSIHNPATTGFAAQAMIGLKVWDGQFDTTIGWLGITSRSYTAGGTGIQPLTTYMENDSAGCALLANNANGKIEFFVGTYATASSIRQRVKPDSTIVFSTVLTHYSGNGGVVVSTQGTSQGINFNLHGTGVPTGVNITKVSNASSASQSFGAINFFVPSSGNIGQFLGTCNNYSNASINLPANACGFLANGAGGLSLIAGLSATEILFTAGGYSSSNQIAKMKFTSGLTTDRRFQTKQGADVASVTGTITLGNDGSVFEITGTNSIDRIANTDYVNGAIIYLQFTSTATLVDGTANSGVNIGMELVGNANFVGSADDVVILVLGEIGGTQRWRMASSSVN